MNILENKKHIEIAPAVGIGIIMIFLAFAGLVFYKILMSQEQALAPIPVEPKNAQTEIENELAVIESELKAGEAGLSDNDLFGLEQLDAELIDFSDIDKFFDFEL